MFKLSGNIVEEPLDEIIEKAKKNEVLNTLNEYGIFEVAKNIIL